MTEEQYKIAKQYYEAKTGKQFELLKLYQMNEWLEKALSSPGRDDRGIKKGHKDDGNCV